MLGAWFKKVLGRKTQRLHSDLHCIFFFILFERYMGLPLECSVAFGDTGRKSKQPGGKQTSLPLFRDKGKSYKRRDLQTYNWNSMKSWLRHLLGSHQEVETEAYVKSCASKEFEASFLPSPFPNELETKQHAFCRKQKNLRRNANRLIAKIIITS